MAATHDAVNLERSPLDLLRLLLAALAAVAAVLLSNYLPDGIDGAEQNLSALLDAPAGWARTIVDLLLVAGVAVASLLVIVVPLVTRRFRMLGYVVAAEAAAALSVGAVDSIVGLSGGTVGDPTTSQELDRDVGIDVAGTAQLIAAFIAVAPFVGRRWRRAGAGLVGAVMVLRLVVSTGQSTHALLALSVGATCGSLVLVLFGRPSTRPTVPTIVASLAAGGLTVSDLHPASVDARGSVPYFATTDDGDPMFVKVLGTDQRAADLLFRAYRAVRLRNVGDERPFSSLRRTVEHEALVALAARDVGVRTPRLRGVAPVEEDSFLLAYERIDGDSLDSVPLDRLSDDVLEQLWRQVAVLQRHRIAHRDLRLANVFLAADDRPWVIDFGFSEIAAEPSLLRADVAQLLASLAVAVGAERSVASAVSSLGAATVAASLGRLQPAALSGSTRSELAERPGLLDQLRSEVERQCDVAAPELEPVTRLGAQQLVALGAMVVFVVLVLPQLAGLSGVLAEARDGRWQWVVPLLVASALTYVAATLVREGSVTTTLPLAPTGAAQVGASFATLFAPGGLGGMALNVRFLQRHGLDTGQASGAVGLGLGAGVLTHVTLLVLFVVWAGRDTLDSVEVPSPTALLVAVLTIVVLGVAVLLLPTTRRGLRTRLGPIVRQANQGLRDALRTPGGIALLLGGSLMLTLANVAAFTFAAEVFDVDLPVATLGAILLVATAVSAFAPTPGGLGIVEAALIGSLVAVGVDEEQAVPTALLFRIGTFWLPVLPGWFALRWLRRTEQL